MVGWSRSIYAGLYPLMIGFNAIPKVAVVPILVLWFGIGFVPAVLTAFLISFFPIVVNVATGLATIEPELEDVLKALGASKLDIMRKVGIPRTLPYFFGSLKVAITLAFVGTVISESIASNNGIGNLMLQAQAQFQVPLIFAGLVALAVEGIVMYWLMAVLEDAHDRLGAALGLRAELTLDAGYPTRRPAARRAAARSPRDAVASRSAVRQRVGELLAILRLAAGAHIDAAENTPAASAAARPPRSRRRAMSARLRGSAHHAEARGHRRAEPEQCSSP